MTVAQAQTVSQFAAIEDPERAAQAVAEATAEPSPDKIVVEDPPNLHVDLPCGLLVDGHLISTAEVRELNGDDEEAIERCKTMMQTIKVVLERAVTRLGDQEPPDPLFLAALPVHDRTALMLAIRIATYGRLLDPIEYQCQSCGDRYGVQIELDKDVPDGGTDAFVPGKREYDVPLRRGSATVSLPTGDDHAYAFGDGSRLLSEANTRLLERCVKTLNGAPVLGVEPIRKMGIADRRKLLEFFTTTPRGPRLEGVVIGCEGCEADVSIPLSLAGIFQF